MDLRDQMEESPDFLSSVYHTVYTEEHPEAKLQTH
jgi:hypothetical protein